MSPTIEVALRLPGPDAATHGRDPAMALLTDHVHHRVVDGHLAPGEDVAAGADGAVRRRLRTRPAPAAAAAVLLLVAAVLGACGSAGPAGEGGSANSPAAGEAGEAVIVFAASSLTEAFREIGAVYERENAGRRVQFQFAGSSRLRLQLEQGAVADVFAPADMEQMDRARDVGLVGDPVRVFTENRLVIIHPADNPAKISSLGDLAREGVRLVTAAPDVPIGAYTLAMLDRAARDGVFGNDFKRRVLANVVSQEPNVRQVVAKVRLGEADAAVVYASDVTPSVRPHLGTVPVPDAYNVTAVYPLAVLKTAPHPAEARDFVELVLSPAGQDILERRGFQPAAGGRR